MGWRLVRLLNDLKNLRFRRMAAIAARETPAACKIEHSKEET
jgi:hypothetical protein